MTQNEQVLAHMARGIPITPKLAYETYGIMRLAARILELRNAGHHIEVDTVGKDGKKMAEYNLARPLAVGRRVKLSAGMSHLLDSPTIGIIEKVISGSGVPAKDWVYVVRFPINGKRKEKWLSLFREEIVHVKACE